MTEPTGTVDDWTGQPDKSLVPMRKAPDRPIDEHNPPPPTEEDLREALLGAEVVPFTGETDGRHDETADGPGDQSGAHRPDDSAQTAAPSGGSRGPARKRGEIFENCPVVPLGKRGKFYYYLDEHGQLRGVDNHTAQVILGLFGHQIPKLCYNFPQWEFRDDPNDPDGPKKRFRKPNRFDQTTASMEMMKAASECGLFNPDNAVRGVGAWTDDEENLIYHLGDQVLYKGKYMPPGRIDGRIYPAAPAIPHPQDPSTAPDPAADILRTVETWNWSQGDFHPFVTLGMISTQMLCGALDWRPVFWLLAPAGAGKSELQKLMKLLHGDDGLVQSTDATKSGITSQLGQSSLPVAVDELEPGDERSTKERDIIALARVAASGGQWFRGSSDQTGVGGKVYSAFLFSSILIPGVMKSQDVQRLIKLELKPLEKGTGKLNLVPKTWRARGARLKSLLIARWPTWQQRLNDWRYSLEKAGVMGRDADNWGTVLAMADMAMSEEIASEEVRDGWACKAAYQVNADRDETTNDADAMLLHLMAMPFDIYRRGELFTVAQWVMAAAGLAGAPEALLGDNTPLDRLDRMKAANSKLAKAGLRVVIEGDRQDLFIANSQIHGLKELFRNSDWANGVWKQSAARVPGARNTPNPLTLAGIRTRGFLMPLKSIPGLMALPMDRDKGNAPTLGDDIEDFDKV
ncbi:hypothetical protein [Shimia sp.]|uniref:hypothetical protein n=1 Tax=Shimia sp. TaxID=1954381 RepID=UPI003BA96DC3